MGTKITLAPESIKPLRGIEHMADPVALSLETRDCHEIDTRLERVMCRCCGVHIKLMTLKVRLRQLSNCPVGCWAREERKLDDVG
jgi:hypothetical protein